MISRRHFLTTSAGASLAGLVPARAATAADPFSFILLGDLHYDAMEHHDLKWLETFKADALSQIQHYSKLSQEMMPQVFAALKTRIVALQKSGAPPALVLQVGDLVQGLCGSEELAVRQNREAIEFVAKADLGLPFLFTKGNHDVTGDGAKEAFNAVLQAFMVEQAGRVDAKSAHAGANYTVRRGETQLVFFDAYDRVSLDWLEAVAAARTARHLFVVVHPPVVPYGARATWHLYASEKTQRQRDKLLEILGQQEAMVLGGHLHKFSALTRKAGGGRFTQLAVSSVVSAANQEMRHVMHGTESYTAEQVNLEPKHAPETVAERRAIYEMERQSVTAFEYADTAGFAVVTIMGDKVEAEIHAGTSDKAFYQVTLVG